MKMVSEAEFNNFPSDMQRKYFKALEENKNAAGRSYSPEKSSQEPFYRSRRYA